MSASLLGSELQGWLHSIRTSSQFKVIRQRFDRSLNVLFVIEPLWVLTAAVFVFLSYLFHLWAFLPWIGLAMAFLPFPLRWVYQGRSRIRTPFDLPIVLLIAGALVGLIISPDWSISLGAFQCVLASSLFYYSWVSYPRIATLMKWLIPIGISSVLLLAISSIIERSRAITTTDSLNPTYHGLALSMLIVAAIFSGVALFGKEKATRVFGGLVCLAILIAIIILVQDSLPRLISGDSVGGRSERWEKTIDLIGDSPFTGLGLGCWALIYHGTLLITAPTHVHNAYLELYSNTGFLGALAFIIALIIGIKLALDIIKSPRNHPWYGFGIGVLFACIATLLVGVVESAPIGVPWVKTDTYYYIISPAPWVLAGLLVSSHRLISRAN